MAPITIQKTFYKVGDFVSWQKTGMLELSPVFQRRSVWKPGAKSFLIDTIIRGFPIPIIFLRDKGIDLKTFQPNREVIDGQQRLRTVLTYIGGTELLPDFNPERDDFTIRPSHNKELAGKRFQDLNSDLQTQILNYEFDVHVLPQLFDDRDILQIFRRMNSTNYSLNPQEKRNAEYFGEFKTSMYQLAGEQLHRWRTWKVFTEDDIARMDEVALTSELATVMLKGDIGARAQIKRYYTTYDAEFPERTEVERRFRAVMDSIDIHLSRDIAYLPFNRTNRFYNLFTCFYDLLFGIDSTLEEIQQSSISPEQIGHIKLATERIQNRTAPDSVLQAFGSINLSDRRTILKYLRDS